jgi:hypothetical protein
MKAENPDRIKVAPREERSILDQIRNDRELIERLNISAQELDALSRCALLGTLTCKQDMLFILRQIRESGGPDQAALIAQPPSFEEEEEDHIPDFRGIAARVAPVIKLEPASVESIVRRRLPAQLGMIFWGFVLVAGLVWNAMIAVSRWHDSYMPLGSAAAQASPSDAWYSHLDGSNSLLWLEFLFVGSVAIVMYMRSRKGTRHLKVRPGGRRLR